jgi:polar amino acid transport system substrate-binding protein
MRKLIPIIASLFFLLGCSQEETKKLKVLTSVEYPPFEMKDGDEFIGFDIDLINEIATRLGYEVDIQHSRFDSLFTRLYNNEADLAIAALTETEERAKLVDFSIPYFFEYDETRDILIVDKDSSITGLADLDGLKLAVETGSIQSQIATITQSSFGYDLKLYNEISKSIDGLLNNEVSAILLEVEFAKTVLLINEDLKGIEIEECIEECEYGYAIAFPKDSELIEMFNEEIRKLIQEDYIDELKQKWLE